MALDRSEGACVAGIRNLIAVSACAAIGAGLLAGSATAVSNPRDSVGAPTSIDLGLPGRSSAVRSLGSGESDAPTGTVPPRVNPLAAEPDHGARGTWNRPRSRTGSAGASSQNAGRTPIPSTVFDGIANPEGCGTCAPPDTTGDVGPDHYVQIVNSTKVAIYDKAGVLQRPAFSLSTLFDSGSCSTTNDGDPQALYDPLADRWLLGQFVTTSPYKMCFAVSQTPDPLGAYNTYSMTTPSFPDYFKIGVWPTGYYVGTNESPYTAYALDRTAMLAGGSATAIRIAGPSNSNFMLPADVDGSTPPDTQGGLFYTFKDAAFHGVSSDLLEVLRFTADFTTPSNSTLTTVRTVTTTPFVYTACGFFNMDCVSQAGTTRKLDVVSEWPMQRFAYRRFADHEALVGNFTVGGGSGPAGAAIRWFELRNTGSGWALHQEGTQDSGDGLDRFMGSIAIDAAGDIALGYSASSPSAYPSMRYATRTASDPLGTLESEQVMVSGGGSQTGSSRWGDYSAMSPDPADDRAFWFTSEYYGATAATSWSTAIGKFVVTAGESAPTPSPPPAVAQASVGGCVTAPRRLPRTGVKQLMASSCVTNAGQLIGVTGSVRRRARGIRVPQLFCQVTRRKTARPSSTGYGDGAWYCASGRLMIRTRGSRLRIRITWAAPTISAYTAYSATRTYAV